MTIKIEIPTDNKRLALCIGKALIEYAGETVVFEEIDEDERDAKIEAFGADDVEEPEAVDTAAAFGKKTEEPEPETAKEPAGEVDKKGVLKDPDYCGSAKVPFYGTGKNKGQWKKRQGVEQDEYDEWYAGELAKLPEKTIDEPEAVDTSKAFSKKTETAATAPTTTGELFTWISEMQTAGRLNQQQIDAAYVGAGNLHGDGGGPFTVPMFMAGDPDRGITAQGAINAFYGILAKQAGA